MFPWSDKRYASKSIAWPFFYRQFGYHQHLLGIVDSCRLAKTTLAEANVHWRECMHHLSGSSLEVPPHHLMRMSPSNTHVGGTGLSRSRVCSSYIGVVGRVKSEKEEGGHVRPRITGGSTPLRAASSIPRRKEERRQEAVQGQKSCVDFACREL